MTKVMIMGVSNDEAIEALMRELGFEKVGEEQPDSGDPEEGDTCTCIACQLRRELFGPKDEEPDDEAREEDADGEKRDPFEETMDVDSAIADVSFHHFEGTTTTVCCITMDNSYTVIGDSSCVMPDRFDAEMGRHIAYQKARAKVTEALAFRACEKF